MCAYCTYSNAYMPRKKLWKYIFSTVIIVTIGRVLAEYDTPLPDFFLNFY